ncbi:hypothetical protein FisN_26Lu034 [Fistulifera solaris]|uniref:Pherophorin domain-containing protein n=1 Tax=Fistulifera solaris TaxID=1519565 RepID=A0A1Z5KDD5_FISSO|nr:hypothetical protein FisN_26Lu034 [Fistulifera solaris]|eukprot:GAX23968.1 hypothetical protein FisN_26Lu034 [Fistulifera solaris]
MKCSSYGPFITLSLLTTTVRAAIEVQAFREPMTLEEKQALVQDDGSRRSMRELQTALTYKGEICSAEAQGMMPCNTFNTICQPDKFDYWLFNLQAGITYTIEVDRITCGLDPSMSLLAGFGTVLPGGCDGRSGSAELAFITYADDNDSLPGSCSGVPSPFSDPKFSVTPDTDGPFTLAVSNFASNIDSCTGALGYQYKVIINPAPSCI